MLIGFKTKYACGCDLHSQKLTVDIIDKKGNQLLHTTIDSTADAFEYTIKKYSKSLTVCVESTFNWYWLNDFCLNRKIPFFLGHALYIKRSRPGKNKNDDIDAQHISSLIKDGRFPAAYNYPPVMRATRDLLRRRMHFVNKRAGAFAHIQNTFYQHGMLEPVGNVLQRKMLRRSILSRFEDVNVSMSLQADLDLIDSLDPIIKKLETHITEQAVIHNKKHFELLQTMIGLGPISALTILYEIHVLERFPSVQDLSSYSRTVKAQCNSAGKTVGKGDDKIGNPTLKWAFCEVANHLIQYCPIVKQWYEKMKRRKGYRCARAILIHKVSIAVYYMLKKETPFDEYKFISAVKPLCAATPSTNWMEASGQSSKPSAMIGSRA